jgi:hypothetical protein
VVSGPWSFLFALTPCRFPLAAARRAPPEPAGCQYSGLTPLRRALKIASVGEILGAERLSRKAMLAQYIDTAMEMAAFEIIDPASGIRYPVSSIRDQFPDV